MVESGQVGAGRPVDDRALEPGFPDLEPDVAARPGRPRPWLLVAAGLPWVVLAAILLAGGPGAEDTPATPPASPAAEDLPTPTDPPTDAPAAPAGDDAPVTAASGTEVVARLVTGGARSSHRAQDAAGVAVAVARLHLSVLPTGDDTDGADPAPGAGRRYVEHLVVEAVDHPGPDLVVVTVLAIVLPTQEGGYGAPRLMRLGVPVRIDPDGAVPAGTPWPLPAPRLEPAPPTPEPVDDAEVVAAAGRALSAAGYGDVEVTAVAATASWPWIVDATATAPGESAPRRHLVWLRTHLDGFAVAGTVPPTGAATPPPNHDDIGSTE